MPNVPETEPKAIFNIRDCVLLAIATGAKARWLVAVGGGRILGDLPVALLRGRAGSAGTG